VLVRQELKPVESAILAALVQVLQRIPESAPLQYLQKKRVRDLLREDVYHYREVVENNGTRRLLFQVCGGLWGAETCWDQPLVTIKKASLERKRRRISMSIRHLLEKTSLYLDVQMLN
jgi:hypothetical protein